MLSPCQIVPWFFNFNILLSSIFNFSDQSFPLPAISRFYSASSTHEFSWPPQAHYKCWCYWNPLGSAVYMYSIYCGRVIINMSSLCSGLMEFDSWQFFRIFFFFHLPVSAVLFDKAAVPSVKFQDKKHLVPFVHIPICFHSGQSVFHLVCLCFCCLDEIIVLWEL